MNCPNCGISDQSRIAGHEVRGVYDGVLFWQCLECGHAWAREWPAGGRLHQVASEMVAEMNKSRDE